MNRLLTSLTVIGSLLVLAVVLPSFIFLGQLLAVKIMLLSGVLA